MSRNRQNFIYKHNNSGHNVMETSSVYELRVAPAANRAPVSKVVVKRGPQLMVMFSGQAKQSKVEALLQAGVKVGLALTSSELAKAPKLDDYSFVFVGMSHKAGSPLKQAVADLAHNGWSIDDTWHTASNRATPRPNDARMRIAELAIA